jgi:hypothetical protein
MPEIQGRQVPVGRYEVQEFLVEGVRRYGIVVDNEPLILWDRWDRNFVAGERFISFTGPEPVQVIKPEYLLPFSSAEDEDT